MKSARRRSHDRKPAPRVTREPADDAVPKEKSPTAVVTEAMRKGVPPRPPERPDDIPHEDELIRVGDPDDDSLQNEYAGDETPGGSSQTPDQSLVDDIGRVYGLQDEDSGVLRSGEDILVRRDRHRQELMPPGKPQP